MIRYALICAFDHEFEGWFDNSADYDVQKDKGLLCCPVCETDQVEKAIMAPAVRSSRKMEARKSDMQAMMNTVTAKIRDEIAQNCEDVGEDFAKVARAIHDGDEAERGIYGRATPEEAEALETDGITAHPLPDVLVPKPKPKLN